jgi:hypothetical protein
MNPKPTAQGKKALHGVLAVLQRAHGRVDRAEKDRVVRREMLDYMALEFADELDIDRAEFLSLLGR